MRRGILRSEMGPPRRLADGAEAHDFTFSNIAWLIASYVIYRGLNDQDANIQLHNKHFSSSEN